MSDTSIVFGNNIMNNCPSCSSERLQPQSGFVVCTECGTTMGRNFVDHLPVNINRFGEDLSHNDIGKNVDFEFSLGSEISYKSKRIYTNKNRRMFRRMMSLHRDSRYNTHVRTMMCFDSIFSRLQHEFGIPDSIKLMAKKKYYELDSDEINNHILLITLTFIWAIKEKNIPVKFLTIVRAFKDDSRRVTPNGIYRLAMQLGINLKYNGPGKYLARLVNEITKNQNVVDRLSETYNISVDRYSQILKRIAIKLLQRINAGGRNPSILAASTIYMCDRYIASYMNTETVLTYNLIGETDVNQHSVRGHVYEFYNDLYDQEEAHMMKFIRSLLE